MATLKWPLIGLAAVMIGMTAIFVFDYGTRYISWKTLTKTELVTKIQSFDKRYGVTSLENTPTFACLYVVECDAEGAKLRLIDDLDDWDIELTRKTIWQRRFDRTCSGRVTNIGLEFVSKTPETEIVAYNRNARWVFYQDRFVQRWNRFQSGSFSDREWEPCTEEKALYANGN